MDSITFTTQVSINSKVASLQRAVLLFTKSFTHQWNSHWEQFGVQYLAQGHFDMQTREAGNQTCGPSDGNHKPSDMEDNQLYLLSYSHSAFFVVSLF